MAGTRGEHVEAVVVVGRDGEDGRVRVHRRRQLREQGEEVGRELEVFLHDHDVAGRGMCRECVREHGLV